MSAEGSRELITRGNLDGIVSAAVFLRRFPSSPVRFVTSPAAAAPLLREGDAEHIFLADLSPAPSLAAAIEDALGSRRITLIDHHPTSQHFDWAVIDGSASAAGLMYRELGADGMEAAVAMADLYENGDGPLVRSVAADIGIDALRHESEMLDFAWRLNVKDDRFRLAAAEQLSRGLLPSAIPCIAERHQEMVRLDRWGKALDNVRRCLRRAGSAAVMEFSGRRPSFHGFGSRALAEAARQEGCRYAIMINHGQDESVVSLRSTAPGGIDLGRFIESFTAQHGVEGGGHPASAGARIPSGSADLLVEQLEAIA